MDPPVEILTVVTSTFAAAVLSCAAVFGLVAGSRRSRSLDLLFAALALVMAWYALSVGLLHSGLVAASPRLVAMSPLLTGYFGPLLLLFTWASLRPLEPLRPSRLAVLSLGAFGTTLSLYLVLAPHVAEQASHWYLERTAEPPRLALALFVAHSASLLLCTGTALGIAIRAAVWPTPEVPRGRAAWVLLPICVGFAALLLNNLVPLLYPQLETARLGPFVVLPAMFLTYASIVDARKLLSELEAQHLILRSYLPEGVVEGIRSGAIRLDQGGQLRTATILFCDIRDFTGLCQQLPPHRVVQLLDSYYDAMGAAVFTRGGMVNKFIGDAVLAVFGLTDDAGSDAEAAFACALDMLTAAETLDAEGRAEGLPPLRIGIGMHRGEIVHGTVGTSHRREYAVIGDAVNVASRVSGLNKELGEPLLLTGAVAQNLPKSTELRPLGKRQLRGRALPTSLYASGPRGRAISKSA